MSAPLVIDLFCGLGGWAEGFLAEGYRVVGFDIERHDYGTGGYPGQLVLQDALALDGAQFKDASVIVASPPCQKYSYMAMPWSRAKEQIKQYEASGEARAELTALFDCCFRIQREAEAAAGHRSSREKERPDSVGAEGYRGISARQNRGAGLPDRQMDPDVAGGGRESSESRRRALAGNRRR